MISNILLYAHFIKFTPNGQFGLNAHMVAMESSALNKLLSLKLAQNNNVNSNDSISFPPDHKNIQWIVGNDTHNQKRIEAI